VDLYQIHRWDYNTPVEETLEALNDVVKSGKALYIGASSMYSWQFAKALFTSDLHGWKRFVSMQPHYNLLYREEEREMLPLCLDQNIAVIPWSPLARGLLTGNRTKERNETLRAKTDEFGKTLYKSEADLKIMERLSETAAKRGLPNATIALAWMLSKPFITAPIVGASKPGHLEDAVAAVSVKLTHEEIAFLEEPYIPMAVAGHS
jgi:aryl-alcohol dehydrogenase-like predicted oxidoreductase